MIDTIKTHFAPVLAALVMGAGGGIGIDRRLEASEHDVHLEKMRLEERREARARCDKSEQRLRDVIKCMAGGAAVNVCFDRIDAELKDG